MFAKRLLAMCTILTLTAMLLAASPAAIGPGPTEAKSVQSLTIFQATKFNAHYVVPRDENIQKLLEEESILFPGASEARVQAAVQEYKREWLARNPDTPNHHKLRALLDKERKGHPPKEPDTIKGLVTLVEFPGTDTFDWCGQSVTTSGPLHNEIAPPGPRDNNTVWYQDATPTLYNELFFGVGPKAGLIINHPNLGAVDLRGNTMANFYLEQSEGAFVPTGVVYPAWLQAAHSEGWYGADSCDGSNSNVRAGDLVKEIIDLIMAGDPDFAWQDFDGDGDGLVDSFTVVHAGMGQEAGGGAQADFSIWSHASSVNLPTGYLVCTAGSPGCPDRDIYVRDYGMDPENIDVGVIAEEFGHAAFGLPDLYTTDYDNSIANWAIMSSGSWNGILGGMQPAPFPLWFRYLIGWAKPVELDYTTGPKLVKVGQLSLRPHGSQQGIKINLPDKEVTIPNPLGTGNAWWSDLGDLVQFTLAREFDLTGATAPVFSFASYWSIETDYDYGYVQVSTDGGATWTYLSDMDGIFGEVEGKPGLTGEGSGTLRFDLTAYAGQPILLRLNYSTDIGFQFEGWWADDFSLDDGETNLFSDDVETGPGDWTVEGGWRIVPVTEIYPRFYLAEWRNLSGFDRGLKYPYQTVYYDEDEWEVDRATFSVPGMLLYFRDGSYRFDYTLDNATYDPPSWGPKHGLIVVDSHSFPYGWSNYFYSTGAPVRLSRRVQTADATFTLQDTTPFTIRLGYDPATGVYQDEPLETKTFGPRPAVSQFHDSLGYYPGFYYIGDGYLYWRDVAASAVVPAQGDYTTKITDLENNPLYGLYGIDVGGTVLGSGNPGDAGVQYGLHLAVLKKARDGSWGEIIVWNSPSVVDLEKRVSHSKVRPGQYLVYTLKVTNKTPAPQTFVVDDPIPAGTTFKTGPYYNPATNSIHWTGRLAPRQTRYAVFVVRVNRDTPAGAIITNEAHLQDGALGDSASVTTEVVK
jgi:immune inhibitor A